MINKLTIKNYALIEELQMDFNNGLSIITGETGAGKSILLGGLSLILGKRADLTAMNDSSKKCVIEATFDIANYNLKSLFKDNDLDYDAETIIRREILPSGKSRAFVNDSPVNLNILSLLGVQLIDIHSQHQTLQITNVDMQLDILDALANNKVTLLEYQEKFVVYKKTKAFLEELKAQKNQALKDHDYNVFLWNELEEAQLLSVDLSALEDEQATLSNIEFVLEELKLANALLNEEQLGILENLSRLKASFYKLADIAKNYTALYERASSSLIEMDDMSSEIIEVQESLELNPKRLEQVNATLQLINNLLLKHGVSDVDALIMIQNTLHEKVESFETIDDDIVQKERDLEMQMEKLNALATLLHRSRVEVVPVFIAQMAAILKDLGMPNADFKIALDFQENYNYKGKDSIDLLFRANKGSSFLPLQKAASGGELSRIMLSIKSILAHYIKLPTIMFDEIDTGVSGEISTKMATIMHQLSRSMQVFSITHLPQIAAKGDHHFKVYKKDTNDKTATHLIKLNDEDRIVEIAQMLGGEKISTSAIAHAKQLLN